MRARARPSGKVNLLSLALLLGLAAGIYSVVIFAPVWMDNLDVMDVVGAAFNQVGHHNDERVVREIHARLKSIGTHRELNESGEMVEVPGLGVPEEDVTFERRPDNTVFIQVKYVREVRLKPTSRWTKVRFSPKKSGVPMGLK